MLSIKAERGSGETWACESGACAVCVAGFLSKRTENKIQIQLLGGKLELNWNQETNNISLTGQPVEVFSGENPDTIEALLLYWRDCCLRHYPVSSLLLELIIY